MTRRRALKGFSEWLKDNPAPDLQALAAAYGGLGNVPDDVMRAFQHKRDAWQLKLRYRHEEQGQ